MAPAWPLGVQGTPGVAWLTPHPCLQASQLGVYKAFVDNYKIALETAEKCSQSNYQFQKISEVSGAGSAPWGQSMCHGMGRGTSSLWPGQPRAPHRGAAPAPRDFWGPPVGLSHLQLCRDGRGLSAVLNPSGFGPCLGSLSRTSAAPGEPWSVPWGLICRAQPQGGDTWVRGMCGGPKP